MSVDDKNIFKKVSELYINEFDAPVYVLTVDKFDGQDIIHGAFINDGNYYDYVFDSNEIGYRYDFEVTQALNYYAAGLMASYGIRNDSDSPLDFVRGFFRLDAQVRCKKGGIPCGKVCLPKGAECRKHGGGRLNTAGGNRLKSGGGSGARAALGLGAAVGATALAYGNRRKIKEAASRISDAIKAGKAEIDEAKTVGKINDEITKNNVQLLNNVGKFEENHLSKTAEQKAKTRQLTQEAVNKAKERGRKEKNILRKTAVKNTVLAAKKELTGEGQIGKLRRKETPQRELIIEITHYKNNNEANNYRNNFRRRANNRQLSRLR